MTLVTFSTLLIMSTLMWGYCLPLTTQKLAGCHISAWLGNKINAERTRWSERNKGLLYESRSDPKRHFDSHIVCCLLPHKLVMKWDLHLSHKCQKTQYIHADKAVVILSDFIEHSHESYKTIEVMENMLVFICFMANLMKKRKTYTDDLLILTTVLRNISTSICLEQTSI